MNKCLERVNGRHFWIPGVSSYAMIPRCRPNSRVFFFKFFFLFMTVTWKMFKANTQISGLYKSQVSYCSRWMLARRTSSWSSRTSRMNPFCCPSLVQASFHCSCNVLIIRSVSWLRFVLLTTRCSPRRLREQALASFSPRRSLVMSTAVEFSYFRWVSFGHLLVLLPLWRSVEKQELTKSSI
jgi:hypothetical protein